MSIEETLNRIADAVEKLVLFQTGRIQPVNTAVVITKPVEVDTAPVVSPEPKAEAKPRGRPPKAKTEVEVAPETKIDIPTVDDVREAVKGFALKHGKDKTIGLLASLGAKDVSSVPEDKRMTLIRLTQNVPTSEAVSAFN
jgi:hypothetical protein